MRSRPKDAARGRVVREALAQLLAAAVQPRHHGADGGVHDLGDLLVGEALDVGEVDHEPDVVGDAVSIAKENGAAVIAITRADSPLSQLADCVLSVMPQEDTERYTPMVTRLLQLVVIDILAIGLALRLGETASLQLEKSKRSIHTKRLKHEKEDS